MQIQIDKNTVDSLIHGYNRELNEARSLVKEMAAEIKKIKEQQDKINEYLFDGSIKNLISKVEAMSLKSEAIERKSEAIERNVKLFDKKIANQIETIEAKGEAFIERVMKTAYGI